MLLPAEVMISLKTIKTLIMLIISNWLLSLTICLLPCKSIYSYNLLMFREAIEQKMKNAYIILYKLNLDIKYIEKQLDYITSMT